MKENNVGNDHISCLLLCNRLPWNLVLQNNKCLLISISVGQGFMHGLAGWLWLSLS